MIATSAVKKASEKRFFRVGVSRCSAWLGLGSGGTAYGQQPPLTLGTGPRIFKFLFPLIGICLLANAAAFGQVTTADIVGTITDASGAVLPGANVTATNAGTGQVRTTQSGGNGDFTFSLLEPGTYSVKVVVPNFQTFSQPTLVVAAGDRARVNATMRPGQTTSTIEVVGQSPLLQSDSSVLQDVIGEHAVQALPLNGRNFVQLAQLTVGANEGPPNGLTSGQRPDDRRQSASISVNGQSDVLNDELIDGLDNNERVIGTLGVRPSIEAMSELRVQTNDYSADAGRTAGGVINVITKSGTNQFHGSVYEYFRNDKLDSKAFDFGAGLPKNKLRQNQYGGSVGGPVFKNKTFFFADYEGFRLVQGQNPSNRLVPTLDQYNALRTNPASLLAPGTTLSQPGLDYALLYPAPNVPGQAQYTSTPIKTQYSSTADGRVDHHFNENNTLFLRWTYNNVTTFTPDVFPSTTVAGVTLLPGGTNYGFSGPATTFAQQFQLGFTHIFTPTVLLQLNAGYTRINTLSAPQDAGTNAAAKFGIPNISIDSSTNGLPQVAVNTLGGLGDSPFVPIHDIDNTFEYNGTLSYTRGAHNFKFGAELIRRQAENIQNNYGQGYFQFQGLQDLLSGTPIYEQRVNELYNPYWRFWEPSAFVQDDWHATKWLTINLGVRYEVYTPQVEKYNHQANFNPANATLFIAGPNDRTAGVKTYYNDVAPRIGFAATLGHGFVIRGGYGESFFPETYTSNASLKNPPFVFNYGPCGNGSGQKACPAPFGNLSAGLPLPVAQPLNPNNLSTFSGGLSDNVIPNLHPSSAQQFNFTVQKAIGANVLTLGWVGEYGRHLAQIINDLNAPAPGNGPRPYAVQLPNIAQIGEVITEGTSSYNAFQASFQRRLTKGFSLDANYTWAHGIDDASGLSNEGNNGYGLLPYQIYKIDKGNSDLDIRHRVAVTATYALPFGPNLKGITSILVRGWSINTLASWETGLPFTITNQNNVAGTSIGNQPDRPNVVGNPNLSNSDLSEFFNTAAIVTQPAGTLGNLARNAFTGPHYRHVDLSAFKDFNITESKLVQFRAECFNISNTPNFANPTASVGTGQFGQVTGLNVNYTPREFQLVLKLLF